MLHVLIVKREKGKMIKVSKWIYLVVIVMSVWFVFNFGRSHFYGHIADTFNLIRLSRFAEQNKKSGLLAHSGAASQLAVGFG